MFQWFDTKECEAFASELAVFMLGELQSRNADKNAGKFSAKAQRTLNKAVSRIVAFKTAHPMNFYKRSKFANAFLWALKDNGCAEDYATELTEWITLRLQ
jgi:hypothetical protein